MEPIALPEGTADALTTLITLFGTDIPRDRLAFLAAMTLFFLGVAIGCALKLPGCRPVLRALLGAIPVSLLTTPLMAEVLAGRYFSQHFPILDQWIELIEGTGELSAASFGFGVIILIGMLSGRILNLVVHAADWLLGLVRGRMGPPPGGTAAPSGG